MKLFDSKYMISERFRKSFSLYKINRKHKDSIIPGSHLSANVNTNKAFITFSIMGVSKFTWEHILGYMPTFFRLVPKATMSSWRLSLWWSCWSQNTRAYELRVQRNVVISLTLLLGVDRKQLWTCLCERAVDLDLAFLFSLPLPVSVSFGRSEESLGGCRSQQWWGCRAVGLHSMYARLTGLTRRRGLCCLVLSCWVRNPIEATWHLKVPSVQQQGKKINHCIFSGLVFWGKIVTPSCIYSAWERRREHSLPLTVVEYGSLGKIAVHSQQAWVVWEYVPSYSAEQLEEIWAGKGKIFHVLSSVMLAASWGMPTEFLWLQPRRCSAQGPKHAPVGSRNALGALCLQVLCAVRMQEVMTSMLGLHWSSPLPTYHWVMVVKSM